eukprot:SAG11_NODE_691_length_7699_cov_3.868026_12_plen_116_part_00
MPGCKQRVCIFKVPLQYIQVPQSKGATKARSARYLLATPTMDGLIERPGALSIGSRNIYFAALAAFRVWRNWGGDRVVDGHIDAVAMPIFGTGYGRVPVWVAAAQMWEAFVDAWT